MTLYQEMKFFIGLFILLLQTPCNGQTQPQVINSSGFFLTNNLYQFDLSIGEPLIQTISGSNSLLTQGFLQPEIKASNQLDLLLSATPIHIYPNPFNAFITIQSDLPNLQFEISDMTGKIVFEQHSAYHLNLEFLSNGIYTLFIYNENKLLINTQKICKIN